MVEITIDPLKVEEYLRDYINVVEAISRGEKPRELEMVLTYLAYETNTKMWTVWETKNKEEIEKFYNKIPYLKIAEITPVGLVEHLTRFNPIGTKAKPPFTSDAVDALDRIRDDLELVLLELWKSLQK